LIYALSEEIGIRRHIDMKIQYPKFLTLLSKFLRCSPCLKFMQCKIARSIKSSWYSVMSFLRWFR